MIRVTGRERSAFDLYAGLNPLPCAEAQHMEQVLARGLRNDGYAVWQK